MNHEQVPVLVIGAGPVGLTLAIDLAWRGIPVVVVEAGDGSATDPRCNTTSARSLEHFRRLGIADSIRAAGLPGDYPSSAHYRTRFADGYDLLKIDLPPSDDIRGGVNRDEWPTPEPQHRIAQIYLEPILRDHAASLPGVELRYHTRLVGLSQDDDGVTAELTDAEGISYKVRSDHLVGCDGARSTVRRSLGIKLAGVDALTDYLSVFLRSAELGAMKKEKAWTTQVLNPEVKASVLAIDGKELWLSHHKFAPGTDTSEIDPADLLEHVVGRPIKFEQLGLVRWTARRIVAETFQSQRVFLAGDAAHLWIPMAGFGMNAGIQEAVTLAWMLAAVNQGWGGPELLSGYDAERRPIGEEVATAVAGVRIYDPVVDPRIEEASEVGDQLREDLGEQLKSLDQGQYQPDGLNFGLHISDSPLIIGDGTPEPPALELAHFEPSARPGARLPHFWRQDGSSVLDHLGPGFTLVRVGANAPRAESFETAAEKRGMPMTVLDLHEPRAAELYENALLLIRPDQHVAWRGNEMPDDPLIVIDQVRGSGVPSGRTATKTAVG